MEKRAFERLPVNLQARMFFGNMIYSVKVTDISENGMFINTKINFALNSIVLTILLLDNDTIKMPVIIKRIEKSDNGLSGNSRRGLGSEVYQTNKEYNDYVSLCKKALSSSSNRTKIIPVQQTPKHDFIIFKKDAQSQLSQSLLSN